ncbi:carbohydrate-binding module family 1 protein [Cucurbitaria berberidis CBS 394.84]|uniref:AA9 family lytic polysaccharide monooxygenase n=1 Tax=Cucurbitaria berberidis CBS 394.84 TaxID=1168544 RepID=A0A9P4GIU1_9PLEO|nr:carbohydrate-binding module family 1 protein [Cucurbitaria berberidis CBS 394.84]KAF1845966.1 carbohydrate-binding module family 1 protein [Cucurbitaria berberidis CBS 394.84]
MKNLASLAGVVALVSSVTGHATFQDLWATCARLPTSNSPVTDVTNSNIRCNANQGAAASKCSVAAGGTVTVEMHQQNNDRSCANEAIGGAHHGPVLVYMSKVADAATADGSSSFFKIFQDTWAKNASGGGGSDDYWGTKDLNSNCGKMDVKIPANLAPGDYLLRAEAIALHSASGLNGAQFYITCYQITVTGSGSLNPSGVSFPGAYKATDPGIQINIYQKLESYVAPGPAVIAGGTEATAGKAGSTVTATAGSPQPTASASKGAVSSTLQTSVKVTSAQATPTGGGGNTGGCTAAKFQQCGGSGFSGCTTCATGSTCKAQSGYYSQCV